MIALMQWVFQSAELALPSTIVFLVLSLCRTDTTSAFVLEQKYAWG